jgi:hypothetical protein
MLVRVGSKKGGRTGLRVCEGARCGGHLGSGLSDLVLEDVGMSRRGMMGTMKQQVPGLWVVQWKCCLLWGCEACLGCWGRPRMRHEAHHIGRMGEHWPECSDSLQRW